MKSLFLSILLFFASSAHLLLAVEIESIEVKPVDETEYVLDSIPFEVGDEFSDSNLSLAKKMLNFTQRYEKIGIFWDQESQTVFFDVLPLETFEDVRWATDTPSGRETIESVCIKKREDQNISQNRIDQIAECITERVQSQGYLDARVAIYPDGEELVVDLSKNSRYEVANVEFSGDFDIPRSYIMKKVRNKEGYPYKPFELSDDLQRIRRYFMQKNYHRAQVYYPEIEVNSAEETVNLDWRIDQGERIEFVFVGDYDKRTHIRKLRETEEVPPEWFVDELLADIKEELIADGYLDAQVTKERVVVNDRLTRVKIDADRGRQYRLLKPTFVGVNDPEEVQDIYDNVSKFREGRYFYEEEYRELFEDRFFKELVRRGYLDTRVRTLEFSIDRDTARVRPVIYMNEGKPFVISEVKFTGVPKAVRELDSFEDLSDFFELGDRFNPIELEELKADLLTEMRSVGFLDASFEVKREELSKGYRFLVEFDSGPQYIVSEVIIRGLRRTRIKVIRRDLRLNEGDIYSREKIQESIEQLLRLGLARSIDIRVLEKFPETGEVYLVVEVLEAARFRFEIGPGYGTSEGLRGVFRATYANIAGTGRRINLFSKANRELEESRLPAADTVLDCTDGNGNLTTTCDREEIPFIERRITLEYFEPDILDYQVDGRVALTHTKDARRNFSVETFASAFILDYRINSHWTYSPEYEIESSNPFNVLSAAQTQLVDDSSPSRLHSLSHSLRSSFLDDRFSPTMGWKGLIRFELFDERYGSDTNFWLATTRQDFFYPLFPVLSKKRQLGVALSLNAGFSETYDGSLEVPVEKRFRVGGESTVRGYPDDAIQPLTRQGVPLRNGGESVFFFRSELNIPIFGSFDLLGFLDGGNIYPENTDFNPFDLRFGAGGGMRFNTPVGPVKIGYAFAIDRQPGEDAGQIYFGIGPI